VSLSIAALLANEELRQHEFPVTKNKVFLAHAGVCALPRRVTEAVAKYAVDCTQGDQEDMFPASRMIRTRELAAQLIGATSQEVAFVGPTSLGLSLVAEGLKFRRNDNILVYQDDYPSNVYPWMHLAEKGVEVRFLNIRNLGQIRSIDVLGQVDENTRLVALASAHFVAGYRVDLETIGKALHKRNILFCVDAIQTLGAFPTPLEHVDFLAADAHKWLLGPCAAGIMFVRKEQQEFLQPIVHGWHNVKCPSYVAQDDMVYRSDARKYEAGSANLLGLAALEASFELLLEVGLENITQELLRKRAWLVPALQAKGYQVLHADVPPPHASGIVTFHRPDTDLTALHATLLEKNIITSLRADRAGNKFIRLSPHFYNTDVELQRVLDLV
jgi:cysteine desulfurase/selenocysteine lyase